MYEKFKVIDGVMHRQSMPNGPWSRMSPEHLTSRLLELEAECRRLMSAPAIVPMNRR